VATISERLQYLLRLDAAQAIKAVDQFGKQAGDAIDGSSGKLDRLGGNMLKFGAGAMATAGIAGKALWSIGAGASDLNESINAVEKTFGDAAEGVLKLGENAAKSIGLSRTEFAQLATGFASFAGTVAGEGGDVVATVKEMTTRAADFASVLNMDVSRAVGLFQTSLAGEAEAMRRFGIDVSAVTVEQYALANGLASSKKELTESVKVQARYGVIMAATESMAGDFADTSDDLANSQRILSADIKNLKDNVGAGLLPAMKFLVTTAGDVTNAFSNMSPEFQKLIGGAAGATVGILAVGGAASFIIGSLIKMTANLKLARIAMLKFSTAHPILLAATVALTAATAIAGLMWLDHSKKQKEAQDKVDDLTTAIQANIAELREQADLLDLLEGGAVATATGYEILADSVRESEQWTGEMTEGFRFLGKTMDSMVPTFVRGQDAVDDFARQQLIAAGASKRHADVLVGNGFKSIKLFTSSTGVARDEAEQFYDANGDLFASLIGLNSAFDLYNVAAVEAARNTLIEIATTDDAGEAAVRHAESIKGVTVEQANNVQIAEMLVTTQAALEAGIISASTAIKSMSWAQEELAKSGTRAAEATELFNEQGELLPEILAQQEDAIQRVIDKHTASVEAIDEAYDAVKDAYDESVREAEQWADGLNSAAEAGGDGFGTFQSTATTDLKKWATALNKSTVAEAQWKDNLVAVYKRAEESVEGSGDAIVTSLADMGTDGAEETQALLDATDEDFGNMASAMATSTAVGQRDVAAELGKLPGHMTLAMSMAEIERSRAMMEANIAARIEARELGNDISSGIGLGISSRAFKIDNAIRDAVEGAILKGREAAETASPSKVTNREIGMPMAEGIAAGITAGAPAVALAVSDAVDDAADAGAESALVFRKEVGAPIIIGVEEGIAEEAPKVSEALVRAINDAESDAVKAAKELSEAVLDEFETLADAAENVLSGLFGDISRTDRVEGLEESVSDAQRNLAEAQEKLTKVQLDGESTAKDLADAQESVSDAEESLRDANMNLTEETIANTLGTEEQQTAWERAATAAGLTAIEIRDLRDAYRELAEAQKALSDAKEAQAAIDAKNDKKIADEVAAAQATVDKFNDLGSKGLLLGKDFTDVKALASDPAKQLDMMRSIIARVEKFFSQFLPEAPISFTPQSMPVAGSLDQPSNIAAMTSNTTGEPPKLGRMLPDADMSAITAAVERGLVQGFKGIRQHERAS
jgi:hypothetical protein